MATSKTALVAGGTGGLGEGIVKVLLEAGWTVWVPIRTVEAGEKLRAYVGKTPGQLLLEKADLSIPAEITALREKTAEGVPLDLVVVSVGSSYYGYSLRKIETTVWNNLLTENLATHFHLQQAFLSQLHDQNSGVYVTLTGPEADFAHPETGLMSILAAAQKMMARVEALETAGTAVKVYSVTSKTPVATRSRGGQSAQEWLTPEELGRYVVALAEGKAPGLNEPLHVLENREQVRKLLK